MESFRWAQLKFNIPEYQITSSCDQILDFEHETSYFLSVPPMSPFSKYFNIIDMTQLVGDQMTHGICQIKEMSGTIYKMDGRGEPDFELSPRVLIDANYFESLRSVKFLTDPILDKE